ncbi:MAG: hypothetical protein KDA49_11620, partial [Rhodospirillaceae bacterium]|nr:hypothetical protein [Rhodospirillaceae bacterium]
TNRRRSSIAELSFHGINTPRENRKVLPMCPVQNVTYVSGRAYARYRASGYLSAGWRDSPSVSAIGAGAAASY